MRSLNTERNAWEFSQRDLKRKRLLESSARLDANMNIATNQGVE